MAGPTPGAIGAVHRSQHASRPSSHQAVTLEGPAGMHVAVETPGGWSAAQTVPVRMRLAVGRPCRLRLTSIPGYEGVELFPSMRLLARIDAPAEDAWRFPVELVIDPDDLVEAIDGALVRRIVFSVADCHESKPPLSFDVEPGADPLLVARSLGEPVLEFVVGNRVPTPAEVP